MLKTVRLLLPALIPSWRFFDTVAPSPRIEFTLLKTEQDVLGDWHEFRPRPPHLSVSGMLKRLFWNPRWNETLFLVSCVERLLENPTEHSSREIVDRICAELGRHGTVSAAAPYLQFRLALIRREGAALQKQIMLTSPAYPFGGPV